MGYEPCKGRNCAAVDGVGHSEECKLEHDASYLGAWISWTKPATDPALLALARLGAWLVETQGEDAGDVDGGRIHDAFERLGVVTVTDVPAGLCFDGHVRDDYCRCCEHFACDEVARCHHWQPGIADAIARLLAPDGAGEADGAGGGWPMTEPTLGSRILDAAADCDSAGEYGVIGADERLRALCARADAAERGMVARLVRDDARADVVEAAFLGKSLKRATERHKAAVVADESALAAWRALGEVDG